MKKTYSISIWSVIALGLLITGLSVFAFYSWSRVGQINEASTQIELNWLPSTQLLGRMEVDTLVYRVAAMQHVLSLENKDMQRYEEEMASALGSLEQAQQRYEPLIVSEEEKDLYESFSSSWTRYLAESQSALALSRENQNQEAITVLRQSPQQLFDEASSQLEALVALNIETATTISREGDDILGEFQLTLIVLLILGGAFLILIVVDLFGKANRSSGTGHLP